MTWTEIGTAVSLVLNAIGGAYLVFRKSRRDDAQGRVDIAKAKVEVAKAAVEVEKAKVEVTAEERADALKEWMAIARNLEKRNAADMARVAEQMRVVGKEMDDLRTRERQSQIENAKLQTQVEYLSAEVKELRVAVEDCQKGHK